ncbi:MAG: hypothetical protein AAF483_22415 [Planctomycetota bacterium]
MTVFTFGAIAGLLLANVVFQGEGLASQAVSSFSEISAGVVIRNPKLEFQFAESEGQVFFGFEVTNNSRQDAKVVGFENSCTCNTIDQEFPFTIPSGQSRFVTGKLDTNGLSNAFTVQSQLFLRTKFRTHQI